MVSNRFAVKFDRHLGRSTNPQQQSMFNKYALQQKSPFNIGCLTRGASDHL
jgi:hypothetical protein